MPVKPAMKSAIGRDSTPNRAMCTASSRSQVVTSGTARATPLANVPNRPNAAVLSRADRPIHASGALMRWFIRAKLTLCACFLRGPRDAFDERCFAEYVGQPVEVQQSFLHCGIELVAQALPIAGKPLREHPELFSVLLG